MLNDSCLPGSLTTPHLIHPTQFVSPRSSSLTISSSDQQVPCRQGISFLLHSTALTKLRDWVRWEMVENGSVDCLECEQSLIASCIPLVCHNSHNARMRALTPHQRHAGINNESSFEAEILKGTKHCQIWGYDFSVKSFGPEIPAESADRTHFHAFGLGGEDKAGPTDEPPFYTLQTLMRQNGMSSLSFNETTFNQILMADHQDTPISTFSRSTSRAGNSTL